MSLILPDGHRGVSPKPPDKTDITLTVDTFIADIPAGENMAILVYLREHGGRRFVRWRLFHRHRKSKLWYPDKRRAFVIPVEAAGMLGRVIQAAAAGQAVTPLPAWLAQQEASQRRCLAILEALNAPPAVLEAEKRRACRGRA